MFHQFPKKKLTEVVCSSDSIQQNIKRGYLQTRTWLEAPFLDSSEILDPLDYGFDLNLNSMTLVPSFFKRPQKPTDVIEPCFGLKYVPKRLVLVELAKLSVMNIVLALRQTARILLMNDILYEMIKIILYIMLIFFNWR